MLGLILVSVFLSIQLWKLRNNLYSKGSQNLLVSKEEQGKMKPTRGKGRMSSLYGSIFCPSSQSELWSDVWREILHVTASFVQICNFHLPPSHVFWCESFFIFYYFISFFSLIISIVVVPDGFVPITKVYQSQVYKFWN